MAKHNETGAKGEAIAAEYLRAKGYQILANNWRAGHKEIDLIIASGGELVFVEVKTRAGLGFGFPEEAVTISKQKMLRAAATEYFEQNPNFIKVRFDVISIIMSGDAVQELLHIEDAFI